MPIKILLQSPDCCAAIHAYGIEKEIEQIHSRIADAYKETGAVIDTSALTFDAGETEPGKALVMINGTLSVDQSGVKTDIPVVVPPVSVSLEGDSWKICPAT